MLKREDFPAIIAAHCQKLEIIESILFDDCDKLQPVKDELFAQYMETKDPEILKLWLETQKVFSLWAQVQHQQRITGMEGDKPRDNKRSREERTKAS
jgi:hypothetical protein